MIRKLFSICLLFSTRSLPLPVLTSVVVLLAAVASAAQEQPTIAKDSVQVTAFTLSSYKGDFKIFSWLPRTQFRVNGPIASGSQLYVEFTVPGTGAWVKYDCKTEETQAGRWWQPECGGRDGIPEETLAIEAGDNNWSNRRTILDGAIQFAKSGGKLIKLEFPKTEIQVYGATAVVYSNYSYELETGGQRVNRSGHVTEVFVLRKGQWVNPGWHMDSGK